MGIYVVVSLSVKDSTPGSRSDADPASQKVASRYSAFEAAQRVFLLRDAPQPLQTPAKWRL